MHIWTCAAAASRDPQVGRQGAFSVISSRVLYDRVLQWGASLDNSYAVCMLDWVGWPQHYERAMNDAALEMRSSGIQGLLWGEWVLYTRMVSGSAIRAGPLERGGAGHVQQRHPGAVHVGG
jgi:hypothetical protein